MGITRREVVKSAISAAALAVAPGLLADSLYTNNDRLMRLSDEPLTSFVFGSCNRSTYSQAYWPTIAKDNAPLWIWMGDNIYADNTTMVERQGLYSSLKANAYYKAFRTNTAIIGTWDDHDFWENDRDGSFPDKQQSKLCAMDFLDIAPDRVADHEGIYQSYLFGSEGRRTKVILLDLRFNMVQQRGKPSSLLGERQWEWLKSEIGRNDYELLVIGSSQNVLNTSGPQAWASFPAERSYLYQWLAPLSQPVLFLSGDRHHGDFSKYQIGSKLGGKTIYEFMSSGLTHSNPIGRSNPNRIGQSVRRKNYGLVRIDWTETVPKLLLQLKSPTTGQVLQEVII